MTSYFSLLAILSKSQCVLMLLLDVLHNANVFILHSLLYCTIHYITVHFWTFCDSCHYFSQTISTVLNIEDVWILNSVLFQTSFCIIYVFKQLYSSSMKIHIQLLFLFSNLKITGKLYNDINNGATVGFNLIMTSVFYISLFLSRKLISWKNHGYYPTIYIYIYI